MALDQVAAFQLLAGSSVGRDHLDAVAGLRIDHIEADRGPLVPRDPENNRTGDQGEAKMVATSDRRRGL
jgi:hypothetical protein